MPGAELPNVGSIEKRRSQNVAGRESLAFITSPQLLPLNERLRANCRETRSSIILSVYKVKVELLFSSGWHRT